ncbi:MAG: AAA family ATPase, partial [Chthonomonadaceae bacterium]|nr:AAA family ATPase [Chthonomonadaceae bacterium]
MSLSDIHSPAPKETLRVQNFGGITDATIELSRMNVFIGPQASGKSVCAKLIYYFRQFVRQMPQLMFRNSTDAAIDKLHTTDFYNRFPSKNWGNTDFKIEYRLGDLEFIVHRPGTENTEVQLTRSKAWDDLLQEVRRLYKVSDSDPPRSQLKQSEAVKTQKEFFQKLARKRIFQLRNSN